MLVMALTSLKIVMKQFASDVNPTLIIIAQLSAPGNAPLTTSLIIPHLTGKATRNTHEANNYTEPNLQLSVSTNKPDQIPKLLEATRKMT